MATYDPGYSRNVDTVRALRDAGVRVEWLGGTPTGTASHALHQHLPVGLAAVGMRLVFGSIARFADLTLRLLRCRALVVGYFGQVDMLLFAPIAKLLGRPVVFNPLATLSDTIIEDRRLASSGGWLAQLIHHIDGWSLRLADLVIVDTLENADYVIRRAGLKPERVVVLPVGVDGSIFYPRERPHDRGSSELDVLFYGKFIPLHGVETIIRAAKLLEATHSGVTFQLIGTGQQYCAARKLADDLDVRNVHWTDWLPYCELGERLRTADVALGVFDGGDKAARVIPNKVHQALACRIPVVTLDSPAARHILVHRESAMLVPPDAPEALASAIGELADDPILREAVANGGRDTWERFASRQRLSEIAGDILDRIGVAR